MSNNGDYGYFGKGSTGYAHYMQSVNETTSSSNYSKSSNSHTSKESDDGDIFWLIIGVVLLILLRPITIPAFLIKIGLE